MQVYVLTASLSVFYSCLCLGLACGFLIYQEEAYQSALNAQVAERRRAKEAEKAAEREVQQCYRLVLPKSFTPQRIRIRTICKQLLMNDVDTYFISFLFFFSVSCVVLVAGHHRRRCDGSSDCSVNATN